MTHEKRYRYVSTDVSVLVVLLPVVIVLTTKSVLLLLCGSGCKVQGTGVSGEVWYA